MVRETAACQPGLLEGMFIMHSMLADSPDGQKIQDAIVSGSGPTKRLPPKDFELHGSANLCGSQLLLGVQRGRRQSGGGADGSDAGAHCAAHRGGAAGVPQCHLRTATAHLVAAPNARAREVVPPKHGCKARRPSDPHRRQKGRGGGGGSARHPTWHWLHRMWLTAAAGVAQLTALHTLHWTCRAESRCASGQQVQLG